ncbi:trypsin, alkaline C-like [Vanessa atalanta]|uniref:trypsin, alkaline C-like n=1 Tax=Vanessa atalanta TaxID=42275 RepID=UPI001FCE0941|nr:trypsin, alkaline C-like [Vanessa atalanta]
MEGESCKVQGSLAIVLRLSRALGLAPLHLVRDRRGYIATFSRPAAVYGYILAFCTPAPSALAPLVVKESETGALNQRIIGGTDADIEDYPFMAFIFISEDGDIFDLNPMCGGSLITSRSVLTAAHCYFDSIKPEYYIVRLGSTFLTSGGHLHKALNWVVHPEYSPPVLYHDIAIVKLATPAIFSNRVAVARIAGPNYSIPDNTTVTATGWGQIYNNGPLSEILQQVDVKKVNHDICRENYAEIYELLEEEYPTNVTTDMICAGILDVGGKDACGGDSGGPLLHQGVVIGVTSFGHECALPNYPGVYIKVPSYTNWIVDNA